MKAYIIIISITSKLKWLFFIGYFIGSIFFDIPHWYLVMLAFLLLFHIEPGGYQGICQIFGNLYAKIKHKPLPSKENYTNKSGYILPFNGKWTVWNGGADKEISHSWGIVAQRYAYDFLIVEDDGKYFDGDGKQVQNYLCYGKEIIAPADGIVVKISDKHNDSRVYNGCKVYCDTWDIRGNYIVIKHNENEYSMTAHIKKGSFRVKTGDTVRQGEVIAQCGNSGNTSEPHIHFQLQSGENCFTSAGLPITFTNIKAEKSGGYKALSNLQPADENSRYIGRGLNVENGGTK